MVKEKPWSNFPDKLLYNDKMSSGMMQSPIAKMRRKRMATD